MGGGKTGCVSCKAGYRGVLLDDGTGLGYIDKCETFTDCSSEPV